MRKTNLKYNIGDKVIITNPEHPFYYLKGREGIIVNYCATHERYDYRIKVDYNDNDFIRFNDREITSITEFKFNKDLKELLK